MSGAEVLFGTVPSGSGSGSGYGSGSGDGYGYGYGDGSGDGYGYGYGDGYGYGYGDGSGDGYGYGYGDGSGYGYGYGDGSGYGDGYGDGSGYGDGYGSKEYWAGLITHFATKWTDAGKARLQELQKAGHTIAYWRSDESGKPCNGGRGSAVKPGDVQKIAGPLQLCGDGALHATMIPPQWKGARVWIVAMIGKVIWDNDNDKCGALEREIIGECLQ